MIDIEHFIKYADRDSLINEILWLRNSLDLAVSTLNEKLKPQLFSSDGFYSQAHTLMVGCPAKQSPEPRSGIPSKLNTLQPNVFLAYYHQQSKKETPHGEEE